MREQKQEFRMKVSCQIREWRKHHQVFNAMHHDHLVYDLHKFRRTSYHRYNDHECTNDILFR
jgi:hypothetical protein